MPREGAKRREPAPDIDAGRGAVAAHPDGPDCKAPVFVRLMNVVSVGISSM